MFCFDADERVTGDLRGFMQGLRVGNCDGIRVQLFDAYMTPEDCAPYRPNQELLNFRRYFGPEQRDILMLWRNRPQITSQEQAREPGRVGRVKVDLYCQHYGKSLSVEHWEETCDYYIRHFPFDTYGRNGSTAKARRSRRIPFQRPLYAWGRGAVQERRADVRGRSATRAAREAGRWRPSTSARYRRGARRPGI